MDLATVRLPEDFAEDPSLLAALEADLRAWTQVAPHPGLVRVHGLERTKTGVVIVMDPEPPITMGAIRRAAAGLEPRARRAWAASRALEIARALDAIGLVHREVSPRGVVFDEEGRARLLPPLHAAFTRPRMGAGTLRAHSLAWMSPEAVLGRACDARSDVYQLGLVAWALAGGAWPPAGTDVALIQAIAAGVTPAPLFGEGDALDALVARATRLEPSARPDDAGAFARAIEELAVDDAAVRRAVADAAPRAPRGESRLLDRPIARPCARRWEDLSPTDDDAVRSCAECALPVQRVRTLGALVTAYGSCVFYDPDPDP